MYQIEVEGGRIDSKVLFKEAMKAMAKAGEWRVVVDMYKNDPLARRAKVTRAKNTVLHLAVLNENDDVVVQLLSSIEGEEEARNILSRQNNLGNTPLHVAAALGLPRICCRLAEKCRELVVMARNTAGETPLYIAARYGKKRTFFVLQDFVPDTLESTLERALHFCQRGDGNTILHAAVHGEYFGLAFEIIKLYPSLVNFYNEIGQTPLHLLANMPLAFKSGSRLRGIDMLFYSSIIVDQLEPRYEPGIYMDPLYVLEREYEINYVTVLMNWSRLLRHFFRSLFGIHRNDAIKREKIKHEHASQVMKELVQQTSYWEYGGDGELSQEKLDTPILIAAKQGVVEMVKSILDSFPEAAQDFDSNHKNIVLLSAEHRQMQVYKHLLERKPMRESLFGMVDKDGNTALHLVARLATTTDPGLIQINIVPQIQLEWKWYKFVENSMEPGFFQQYNNMGETAIGIFCKLHESLVKEALKWLANTSEACCVVSVLVAGVAYTSMTTVPGGLNQTSGFPILKQALPYKLFAWSAFGAFYTSILSLVMFFDLIIYSWNEKQFEREMPMRFNIGIRMLFCSILMMMYSFFFGFALMIESDILDKAFKPILIFFTFWCGTELLLLLFGMKNFWSTKLQLNELTF